MSLVYNIIDDLKNVKLKKLKLYIFLYIFIIKNYTIVQFFFIVI